MIHRAKVASWLAVLLGGAALLEFAAAVAVLAAGTITGEPMPAAAATIASMCAGVGLLMGLVLWGCYKTRYEVISSDLIVRFGPFRTSAR